MGGKKKRQESTLLSASSSFRSSSYRQDSTSTAPQSNHAKTVNVGCMSGIFQLMSKYHTRRKFLTFGRKQERNAIVQATASPPRHKHPQPKPEDTIQREPPGRGSSVGRLSTGSSASTPRVVARLMGLDEIPVPAPALEVSPASEKRRKLLGALEKCEDDLTALKKIIEAVRATQTPPRVVARERKEVVEEGESEVGSDEPSPVSVLDHHHLSSGYSKRTPNEKIMQQIQKLKPQKQQITRKRPGDHEDRAIHFLNKPSFSVLVTTPSQPLHLPAKSSEPLLNTLATTSTTAAATPPPLGTAMIESVIEVCRDVELGQIQEVGRIGLLLQDFIMRELIDEMIKELGSCNFHVYNTASLSLSCEAYKRKLHFLESCCN